MHRFQMAITTTLITRKGDFGVRETIDAERTVLHQNEMMNGRSCSPTTIDQVECSSTRYADGFIPGTRYGRDMDRGPLGGSGDAMHMKDD